MPTTLPKPAGVTDAKKQSTALRVIISSLPKPNENDQSWTHQSIELITDFWRTAYSTESIRICAAYASKLDVNEFKKMAKREIISLLIKDRIVPWPWATFPAVFNANADAAIAEQAEVNRLAAEAERAKIQAAESKPGFWPPIEPSKLSFKPLPRLSPTIKLLSSAPKPSGGPMPPTPQGLQPSIQPPTSHLPPAQPMTSRLTSPLRS
jgi:hypothetical protein